MKSSPIINIKSFYIMMFIIHYAVLGIMIGFPFDVWVFLFLLMTLAGITLRWRLKLNDYTMFVDIAILLILMMLDSKAVLFIPIVLYQLSFKGKPLYSLFFILYVFLAKLDVSLIWFGLSATLFGLILFGWEKTYQDQLKKYDYLRMQKYDLIYDQSQLTYENMHIEHQARMSERQMIAEMLHDNLGHELSGASLSLKAYQTLIEVKKDEDAKKHLAIARKKVDASLEQLKHAVKTIEPVSHGLIEELFKIINDFFYPIDFKVMGDLNKLRMTRFQMINMITKEALTNIMKHAKPTYITYSIEITEHLVRLLIVNDGLLRGSGFEGHGLRYMRTRIETIGGTLSIDKNQIFQLIVTLPTKETKI